MEESRKMDFRTDHVNVKRPTEHLKKSTRNQRVIGDGWMNGRRQAKAFGCSDAQTNVHTDRLKDQQADRQMHKRTDKQTDRQTCIRPNALTVGPLHICRRLAFKFGDKEPQAEAPFDEGDAECEPGRRAALRQ